MSEPSQSTALTATPEKHPATTISATATVSPETSRIFQLVEQSEGAEKPRKLFEGWYEFIKAGQLPLRLSYLRVYTFNAETVALVSHKPQLISHREAAEQIVAELSLSPAQFLYLVRVPAGTTLCRDLVTAYLFDWEWRRGRWVTTQQTYCYRVSDHIEDAIQHLFQIDLSSVDSSTVVENAQSV